VAAVVTVAAAVVLAIGGAPGPAYAAGHPAATPAAPAAPVVPVLSSIASNCTTDVSAPLTAYLAALPSGATFDAPPGACYLVDEGVIVSHPLTIVGGTYRDQSTTRPTTGYQVLHPVIRIIDTSDVTLSHLSVFGADTTGLYREQLSTEAGVKVVSSSHVTLDDITVSDTFGDGLELVADLTHHITTPDTDLVVDGYTTDHTGRQGITFAEVSGATLTDVHVSSPWFDGFDFESDIPGMGSGNVRISDCTYDHSANLVEYLTGPITITDCAGSSAVALGSQHSDQPVRFVGGSVQCGGRDPQACITQRGGSLEFSHVTFTRRQPNVRMTELAWSVEDGGHLTLAGSPVPGPSGRSDSHSTGTNTPG
jgi:hypothetical protein